MSNNLNTKVTKTATRWKERAKQDHSNRQSITRSQAFALELLNYMAFHKLKQKDLAEKMGVTPQQVNKILRAKENLTFETVDKIAEALGVKISTPKIVSTNSVNPQMQIPLMQVIHRRTTKEIKLDAKTDKFTKTNPVLHLTIENMNEYQNIVGHN